MPSSFSGQDAHKETHTRLHEATNYLLKESVWSCSGAEQFISRLSSLPQHPESQRPGPDPHLPASQPASHQAGVKLHPSKALITIIDQSNDRAWGASAFPRFTEIRVKSRKITIMIILNDEALTTRQLPHASLLCADWRLHTKTHTFVGQIVKKDKTHYMLTYCSTCSFISYKGVLPRGRTDPDSAPSAAFWMQSAHFLRTCEDLWECWLLPRIQDKQPKFWN